MFLGIAEAMWQTLEPKSVCSKKHHHIIHCHSYHGQVNHIRSKQWIVLAASRVVVSYRGPIDFWSLSPKICTWAMWMAGAGCTGIQCNFFTSWNCCLANILNLIYNYLIYLNYESWHYILNRFPYLLFSSSFWLNKFVFLARFGIVCCISPLYPLCVQTLRIAYTHAPYEPPWKPQLCPLRSLVIWYGYASHSPFTSVIYLWKMRIFSSRVVEFPEVSRG